MTSDPVRVPRSLLYVPANRPDLFTKAGNGPADAIVLDLEDAVPLAERATARENVVAWLAELTGAPAQARPQTWVRLDPATLADDVPAIAQNTLSGVILAKCSVETLDRLDELLGDRAVPVIGLVETAVVLADLTPVARHHRLLTLGIGEVDLLADIGMTLTPRTLETVNVLRAQVVLQCATAGLHPPVAPTSVEFTDLAGFRETSLLLRDLGFGSRTAIHPGQVTVVNEVMTPSAEEVRAAADIVQRLHQARTGVALDDSGRLIDAAVARAAQRILDRSAAAHS